ncbi:unnamed protein product [Gordionus sp. m RMFG-2023]
MYYVSFIIQVAQFGFSKDPTRALSKARDPFLQAVAEVLGVRSSENMQSIYKRAIDFILNTLCEGWKSGIELNKPISNHILKKIKYF